MSRALDWMIDVLLVVFLSSLGGCGDTGQALIRVPVDVESFGEVFQSRDGWEVTLTEARVGLGPIYFCATQSASADLCPSAVAEFAQTFEVNALVAGPQAAGELYGFEGEVRSATYDYGYSWRLTQAQPQPSAKTPQGHSAYFVGAATKDTRRVQFIAAVDVKPQIQGLRAVQGARTQALLSDGARLRIEIDVRAWWSGVDFEALAAEPNAAEGLVLTADSRAINALIIAMTATAQPRFVWTN